MAATQQFFADLQSPATANFHSDPQVFSIHADSIRVYLPGGQVTLNLPTEIDMVTALEVVKIPDSAFYIVLIFG
jgi:hypothetical protein